MQQLQRLTKAATIINNRYKRIRKPRLFFVLTTATRKLHVYSSSSDFQKARAGQELMGVHIKQTTYL
jgi:hypothetical protein